MTNNLIVEKPADYFKTQRDENMRVARAALVSREHTFWESNNAIVIESVRRARRWNHQFLNLKRGAAV